MHYVMSDLHGQFSLYKKMLEQISFSDADTLYILGDVLDRGPGPMNILLDMMKRPNVVYLCGNHEQMGLTCLTFLSRDITAETLEEAERNAAALSHKLMIWERNGSQPTIRDFQSLGRTQRKEILEYMGNAELFAQVEVGEKTYILVHAGLGNFSPDRDLEDYTPHDLLWTRPDYEVPYFTDDRYVITGHTPTQLIPGAERPGYIFKKNHHIAIDCGAFSAQGRLACIRLEDEAEFYAEH